MEPIPSSPISPPDHHQDRRSSSRFQPTQAYADRVLRALRHRLLLLYRTDPNFYVLGATGNVYVVNVSTTLTCTCPDRAIPCKHILFVLIKVLGVSLDDSCLRRRTLRPCQLSRLLNIPSSPESLAAPMLRERFHQVFFLQRELGGTGHAPCTTIEEGSTCPICLEEMGKAGERVVACSTCRNPLHEECLMIWKRTQRRRCVSCVICRSRWRSRHRVDQDHKYLNLAAFINENNDHLNNNHQNNNGCMDL
ncbi:hypothetical protein RND81_08G198500 [Saponaria officinalis]|uniref:Mitogen-activated protein kinase kinase kinase 1 n=1 Tax=Saponaria officinalis TaxID=3572 RepID=A0AAW1JAU6_SAPOF